MKTSHNAEDIERAKQDLEIDQERILRKTAHDLSMAEKKAARKYGKERSLYGAAADQKWASDAHGGRYEQLENTLHRVLKDRN